MAKVKDELIALVQELMTECGERHAHEDILMQQVHDLGGEPIPMSETSPWHVDIDYYTEALESSAQ